MSWGHSTVGRLLAPRVEPIKRMVGGRFTWAVHRFPIKDGISVQDAMNRDIREQLSRPNRLLQLLRPR